MEPPADTDIDELRRRYEREHEARLAAENAAERGLQELYAKQQQLELLEAIAVAANLATNLHDALRLAITRICLFTGWPLGHAYVVRQPAGEKELVSTSIWHGVDIIGTQEFHRETAALRLKPGIGLPGRVLETAAPIWIAEVTTDVNFPRGQAAHRLGIKSAFGVPVLVSDEVAAVLEFFSYDAVEPDATLLRLISQIGTQLGRVAERQNADEKLIHDASHDPLTGLPNRALFLDRLRRAIARHERQQGANFAVLFIDIDRFKVVNDSLGHLVGDALIVEVAARFSASLRQSDMMARAHPRGSDAANAPMQHPGYQPLARLGGDEFTILLEDLPDISTAIRIADRIQEALKQPFSLQGQDIHVTASIGIASSATGYRAPEEVLRDADLAMYRAKNAGRGRYEVYDDSMHLVAMNRLAVETNLRRAVQNDEFVLHYQPIVDLRSGVITGFEALVRWQPPDGKLIYPGDFIDIAEDTGLILPIGMWVLREACHRMRHWQTASARAKPLTISINLSARQFAQADLVDQIRATIAETGIDPRTVRLELTESVTMGNAERAIIVLEQLRALGVGISIDDFGTGYSSLSYLHRLPLDVLKIDRSFVAQIGSGVEGTPIVQTIMSLARHLNMDVVAEGIETEDHVTALRALGCESGQGYFFAKPVPRGEVEGLMNRVFPLFASAGSSWS